MTDPPPHAYVRQKVSQALGCLVGSGSLSTRLPMAGSILSELKIQPDLIRNLPDDLHDKLQAVLRALARHPPEGPHDSGWAASVRRLSERERGVIAADILDVYDGLNGGI
jgi:hypothetical protein